MSTCSWGKEPRLCLSDINVVYVVSLDKNVMDGQCTFDVCVDR